MYKIIKTQIRQNLDTKFYFELSPNSPEYQQYIKKNYIDTGKIIWQERKMSEDKLSLTSTSIWRSRLDFLSFTTDPVTYDISVATRNHDVEHNIEAIITVEKGTP